MLTTYSSSSAPSSSSSSTASGPTTRGHGHNQKTSVKGNNGTERPKTEDFLTFLCLRGTNLLPPELDFFNKATLTSGGQDDLDDSSEDGTGDEDLSDQETKFGVAKKSVNRYSIILTYI